MRINGSWEKTAVGGSALTAEIEPPHPNIILEYKVQSGIKGGGKLSEMLQVSLYHMKAEFRLKDVCR